MFPTTVPGQSGCESGMKWSWCKSFGDPQYAQAPPKALRQSSQSALLHSKGSPVFRWRRLALWTLELACLVFFPRSDSRYRFRSFLIFCLPSTDCLIFARPSRAFALAHSRHQEASPLLHRGFGPKYSRVAGYVAPHFVHLCIPGSACCRRSPGPNFLDRRFRSASVCATHSRQREKKPSGRLGRGLKYSAERGLTTPHFVHCLTDVCGSRLGMTKSYRLPKS